METLLSAPWSSPVGLLANQYGIFYLKLSATVAVLFLAVIYMRRETLYPSIPLARLNEEKDLQKLKLSFASQAFEIIDYGIQKFRKPFQVLTPSGTTIILPNRYVDEIKGDPRLSFSENMKHEFLGHIRGLDGFGSIFETPIFTDTVRTKLTRALGALTEDLREESEATLLDCLGEPQEWTDLTLKPFCLKLVSRISTRVFLGPEICRNEEWTNLFVNYTITAFQAIHELRHYPTFLRPLVNIFLPNSRQMRETLARARAILAPEIEKRRKLAAELAARGESDKSKDTIAWMDEVAKGREYDPVIHQLFFSVAAVHTTSDLIAKAIIELALHPEVMDELREEARRVLAEDGWSKTSLYKMKLMDSFLKETLRVNPVSCANMSRIALEAVTLRDGTHIPKGARITCSMDRLNDPHVYPEPEKFDAHRFLRLRAQPNQESSWQFVTTTESNLNFGHGVHACPGRFFASNESKIALAHLILIYDWRLPNGVTKRPQPQIRMVEMQVDPRTKVSFKRRSESALE